MYLMLLDYADIILLRVLLDAAKRAIMPGLRCQDYAHEDAWWRRGGDDKSDKRDVLRYMYYSLIT